MAIPGNFLSSVTEQVDPNTSGWTAMLNATISLGTGGRNGDGCLAIRSVAAGEMRARTVSSYPVAEGVVYEAFADASGATVPERIGIRWLSAAGAEISITWSLTTASASASWHRVVVAGPAPAGAVRAQVVISSTPAAAAVVTTAENVYLGLPLRTTGNLLSFNTESPEVDLTGWNVAANCTLTRTVPAVAWPVDYYLAGGHVLTATVTAAGDARIKNAANVSATPGIEYVAFCYLNAPTTAAQTWIELRFVDDAGTVLASQQSQLAAPSATAWCRQIASATAPAGTTGIAVAVGITGGTAGQVWRADSVVVADRVTVTAMGLLAGQVDDNAVSFADSDFEQGVGGWSVTSGSATLARSTPWGVQADANGYSLVATAGSATSFTIASGQYAVHPLDDPGLTWEVVYSLHTAAAGWKVTGHLTWYDASGVVVRTDDDTTATIPSAGWWLLTSDYAPPVGAAAARLVIDLVPSASGAAAWIDTISLTPALPLTSLVVDATAAAVQLTHRGLAATDLLWLWRVDASGQRTLVRGPAGLLDGYAMTASTFVVTDYEAPLGVPVSYYSEVRDSDGTLVDATTWVTVTVPAPDVNSAWLKDPGNPQRNLLVMLPSGGGPSWQRPIDQASYVVKGRRNKVTLSGVRQGREGDMQVWTRSAAERDALDHLLDPGNVLLIQSAPSTGVGSVYAAVGQSTEDRSGQDSTDVWRTWTLPLVEADMPTAVGVAGAAGRTWQDILSEFATWANVRDAFGTWEDVFLNRRKG